MTRDDNTFRCGGDSGDRRGRSLNLRSPKREEDGGIRRMSRDARNGLEEEEVFGGPGRSKFGR